jgi:hypothetical protein
MPKQQRIRSGRYVGYGLIELAVALGLVAACPSVGLLELFFWRGLPQLDPVAKPRKFHNGPYATQAR